MNHPTILVIGTGDTKADELRFLRAGIEGQGGRALTMDVGILSDPVDPPDIAAETVAAAAGTTRADLARGGDENAAMTAMARGAAQLAAGLQAEGRIHGMIALGGTMGTDLALDVAAALPVGVPKVILSTVAFSHLLPPERIPPDLTMILWAGGLYGLNSLSRASLAQAAGAVVGAARAAVPPAWDRPVVGITSLGSSCLKYMLALKPALEARGFEAAVFHATGLGGRAFERLAAEGRFAAVFDLCLQELQNDLNGSVVTAGPGRLTAAGARGIPQIVAPGATDMVDLETWRPLPARFADRPYHAHNRLIASITLPPEDRRRFAEVVAERLAAAKGPVAVVLPLGGIEEWDRPGGGLHDPAGLAALIDGFRTALPATVERVEVDAHINDAAFVDAVLAIFDRWLADGTVARPNC